MRKFLLVVTIICFFAVNFVFAAENSYTQLVSELKKGGITDSEINSMGNSMKNMLTKGANKEDVKTVVIDLVRLGLHGRELKNSVNDMNDLVNAGESPKQAGNIVSKAAHDAKAQGLTGRALAEKVHEAIRQRKQEKAKEKAQKQKGKHKGWK